MVVVLTLFPIFLLISISFKGQFEWLAHPYHWLPKIPTLSNYASVFGTQLGVRAISNSLTVALGGTVLALFVGYPAAYVISRHTAGKFSLFIEPLILRASPPVVFAIPLLVFYSSVGLIDKLQGLVPLYGATTVFYIIWLTKPFIDAVPREIEEAAMADGVARWRLPFSVILPLVAGGVAAATIFVFILNWTEFTFALTLTLYAARTVPIQMTTLNSQYSVAGNGQAAALSTVSLIPFLLIAYYLQKQLVRAFYVGAVKK